MHSNIKNNEASDNTNNQEFLNNFLENEYSPCITGITRSGDNNSGSCIDNIFIKSNTFETTSYKLTNPITVHYTLLVNIDNVTLSTNTFQNLKPINYRKLIHIANSTYWNEILSIQDPEFAVEKLIELIQECTDKATTINNKKRYNKSLVPRKKWITSAIMKSCQTKETLYTLRRSNPDNVTLKSDYKTYFKLLDKVTKMLKLNMKKIK